MEISMLNQFLVFLASLLIGAILGIVYDVVRILRALMGLHYESRINNRLAKIDFNKIENPLKRKKTHAKEQILLFITDLLYFFIATIVMMIFVYYVNYGIARWYIFAGAIVGMFIYSFLIGKFVISILEAVLFFLKIVFLYILYFTFLPFKLVLKKIRIKISIKRDNIKQKRYNKKISDVTIIRHKLIGFGKK